MSAPTSTGPVEPAGIVIRRARPDEAGALSALAERAKRHWGHGDAFIDATRHDIAVTPDQISCHECVLLKADTAVAGFYLLEENELTRLFVEPAFMGQGHGARLMSHLRTSASAHGLGSIVIVSDPNAASFYERIGAIRIGHHRSEDIPGRMLPILELALEHPHPSD